MGELGLDSCEDHSRPPAREGDESQVEFASQGASLLGERGGGELGCDGGAVVEKVCVADNGDLDGKLGVKQYDCCLSVQNGFLESGGLREWPQVCLGAEKVSMDEFCNACCVGAENGSLSSDEVEALEGAENSCSLANDCNDSSENTENGSEGRVFGQKEVEEGCGCASAVDEGNEQWTLENEPLVLTYLNVEEKKHSELLVAPLECLAAELHETSGDIHNPLGHTSDRNREDNQLNTSETVHGTSFYCKRAEKENMVGDTCGPWQNMNEGCREETRQCASETTQVTISECMGAENEQTVADTCSPLECINRCTDKSHLFPSERVSLECIAVEQVKKVAEFYKPLEPINDGSREKNHLSPPETVQDMSLNCISAAQKQKVENSCSSLKFINGENGTDQLYITGTIQDTSLVMGAKQEQMVVNAWSLLQHMADGNGEGVQLCSSGNGQCMSSDILPKKEQTAANICSTVEPVSNASREVEQLHNSEAIGGMPLVCIAVHRSQMVAGTSIPLEQIAGSDWEGVQSCGTEIEGVSLERILAQEGPMEADNHGPLEKASMLQVVYEVQLNAPEIVQSRTLECMEAQKEQTAPETCCLPGENGAPLQVAWERRCQASHVNREDSSLLPCPTSIGATSCALDRSSHTGSFKFSTSVVDGPSELSLAMNSQFSDVVNKVSTCHISPSDSSAQKDNGRPDKAKSSSLIVFRRNPRRAASSRSSLADVQPNSLSRTSSGRKSRQAAEAPVSLFSSLGNISSNKVTKKRSFPLKPSRVSVWGDAQNLVNIFRQDSELATCDAHAMKLPKRSSRHRSCVDRRKGKKGSIERSSGGPKAKYLASSDPSCPNFRAPVQAAVNDIVLNSDGQLNLGSEKEASQVDCKYGEGTVGVKDKLLLQNGQHGDKDLESTVTQDISVENTIGDCSGTSQADQESLVDRVDDRHLLEPGNSPDSVVSHPLTDVAVLASEGAASTDSEAGVGNSVSSLDQDGVDVALSTSLKICSTPVSDEARDTEQHYKHVKGKKEKRLRRKDLLCNGMLQVPESWRKGKTSSSHSNSVCKEQNVSVRSSRINSRKTSRKVSKGKCSPMDTSVLRKSDLDCSELSTRVEGPLEKQVLPGQGNENAEVMVGLLDDSLPAGKTEGKKLRRCNRVKDRSKNSESACDRRRNSRGRKKVELRKSDSKGKTLRKSEKFDSTVEASGSTNIISGAANKPTFSSSTELSSKTNTASEVASKDVSSSLMMPVANDVLSRGLNQATLQPRLAWVLCDDCQQWRCISAELADYIDATNCKWTCKENTDKAFADCSIPQQKTNAEINAELDISDASCEEDNVPNFSKGLEPAKRAAAERTSWKLIKSNFFMHRNRKTQTIDEIMVCHCKPPSDGSLGCGEECLNRMLNIECIEGMCPCGDLCSNQQFQRRKYAKFKSVRFGKKGYGLQLEEDVRHGKFLIEYVGEVLDLAAYEARQRNYASSGQKHFYFMTLNGGEVIDACTKGNQGRFINHSCDPNCRTEKWMVNGEVCIGIFAIRNIKQGEEVTFDYNYVRVFGAAAKKCVCGSSICRGYIGGDPLNSEVIDQGDSDEEYPEPIMVQEDTNKTISAINDGKAVRYEISVEDIDIRSKCLSPAPDTCLQTEVCVSSEHSDSKKAENNMILPLSDGQQMQELSQSLDIVHAEEVMPQTVSHVETVSNSSQTAVCPNEISPNPVEEKSNTTKLSPLGKVSRPSASVKKGKSSTKHLVPQKAGKVLKHAGNRQFEGVEEKLNELLDPEGGISKRKDATKGYLKLLFVTAAAGDNVRGCASQSLRDLSLILDALLKTKSRLVLMDIINKNGLQMLHNIMKQNRSNFNRIPIIRKLLKVLEFLALKGILTPEHMIRSPPCSGMESFKESMLILTRHNDTQVHQIARNFRDKWIPRSIKRIESSDRDDSSLDSIRSYCNWFQSSLHKRWKHDQGARDSDAIVCVSDDNHLEIPEVGIHPFVASHQISNPAPGIDSNPASGERPRKRKSRWDQPSDNMIHDQLSSHTSDDQTGEAGAKLTKLTHMQREPSSDPVISKPASEIQREKCSSLDVAASATVSTQENIDDEAPPGFGSCTKHNPQVLCTTSWDTGEVVMGHLQERYLSNLTVSYGMPVALMQQLGTLESGGTESRPYWAIAPGMPFHPFPPLPPYPRGNPGPMAPVQTSSNINLTEGCSEEAQVAIGLPIVASSATSETRSHEVVSGARYPKIAERVRFHSNDSGKRFFQTQRWNSPKVQRCRPRWPREGNGYRFRGSSRNGAPGMYIENARDVKNGSCNPEGILCKNVNLNYNQHSENN